MISLGNGVQGCGGSEGRKKPLLPAAPFPCVKEH